MIQHKLKWFCIIAVWLLLLAHLHVGAQIQKNNYFSYLQASNVVWHSPGENSLGSMPSGNGDLGINLWVEKNGDMLFYLSKTDAWSENARLLKLGKVRLSLSPNPFKDGNYFLQKLILEDGTIRVEAGKESERVTIDIWVDANNPVVELDVKSKKPVHANVRTEPWRTERRLLNNATELHSAYGLNGKDAPTVFIEKDTILKESGNRVIWAHRNERSIWKDNLELQGLGNDMLTQQDPLLYRTFGAAIYSEGLRKNGSSDLVTSKPLKSFSVSVYAVTSQTETLGKWVSQLTELSEGIRKKSRAARFSKHLAWWNDFWNKSSIHITTQKQDKKETISTINRGYALQRYLLACSGRGNSPIKFNGSIFTVDTKDLRGEFEGFDADYRRWGGPYWWQNTRLPYWAMLESGDAEMMKPLFKMYLDALPLRELATQTYYNHTGAFFPETMYFWGTYVDANYGRSRVGLPPGMTENGYIRYYWQGGLELSLMMLDYYAFTKDEPFLTGTLLPVVSAIITFFDEHWNRDEKGKIRFDPAMSLETYSKAVNPLPEIAGIQKVCEELLSLSSPKITAAQKTTWKRMLSELPAMPVREINGLKLLVPAQEYSGKQNTENPELYAIFPYRIFGVGKPGLEMAQHTFAAREEKKTGGWQQNAIKAALLGLRDEAAALTSANFNNSNSAYRFPAMWGPNYDWTPDQDHGSVAMIALQKMLLQYDGDKIYLLSAWPVDWDVSFRLHAPENTTIDCKVENGKITRLDIHPESRRKNVVIAPPFEN